MHERFKHISEEEFPDVKAAAQQRAREAAIEEQTRRLQERATEIATRAEKVTGWKWKGGWDLSPQFTIYSAENGRSLSLLCDVDRTKPISFQAHYESWCSGVRRKVPDEELETALVEVCALLQAHHEKLAEAWTTHPPEDNDDEQEREEA